MEQTLFQSSRFAVLSCDAGKACGILFCRRAKAWSVERSCCQNASGPHGAVLKELLKELGCSEKEKIYLSGIIPGSCVFRYASVDLPRSEQLSAIETALPEVLPVPIEDPRIQFFAQKQEESAEVQLQVCVSPGAEFNKLCADLAENGLRADEFVNPLLLLNDDDPAFFTGNPEYCFHKGTWQTLSDETERQKALKSWEEIARSLMTLPENFNISDFLPLFPVARQEIKNPPVSSISSLRLLPEKLRPLRYRHQLELTGILVLLLIIASMWGNIREWSVQYSRYNEIMSECQKGRNRIGAINSKLKRNAKQEREMSRIVNLQAGEEQFLVKLAALSRILPDNVQLVNLRMSEGSWDLMLQSESTALNLPALINPLGYWKIAQFQQRQMWNSDVTTINLRLVPNDTQEKAAAVKRSGKKGKRTK